MRTRRSRWALGLFVATLVLVVAATIAVSVRPELWPFRPRVALLGDSITVVSEDALRGELRHDYRLDIEATSGLRTDQLVPAVDAEVPPGQDQVVINLGTNDVGQSWPLEQSEASLRELLARFPDARCIHLVTVNERILDFAGRGAENERARAFNAMLARVAASRPGADVVDWTAEVDAYVAAGEPEGPFTTDSVHPTPAGQRALARMYHRALDACGSGS